MRITNNMIVNNTKVNMNLNKVNVDIYNNQMSNQKKISRPSDDAIVAIRSLRLSDNLSEVSQYYEKNIPDAESWLDVTETALVNMNKLLNDVYKECVNGSTDTLTADNRNAILKNLQALQDQVYQEGNADYAGRTVFTGYKTNQTLTFTNDENNTQYTLTENFTYHDIEETKYHANLVKVPKTAAEIAAGIPTEGVADNTDPTKSPMPDMIVNERIRLSYDNIDTNPAPEITVTYKDAAGVDQTQTITATVTNSKDWETAQYQIGDNEVLFIQDTGEIIVGKNVSEDLKTNKANIAVEYTKTGFKKGELRPEHYYDCTKTDTVSGHSVTYTKENQEITYMISANQLLAINTQPEEVFDSSIGRDVQELTNIVQAAIDAHAKITEIKGMMKEAQYEGEEIQAQLKLWLKAAEKEAAYADDNMQKVYGNYVTKFQNYMTDVNLTITDVGSKASRLALTKDRMCSQKSNIEELKSTNEDRELSDIVIDYTAAYTAYTASLQAASKINSSSLLDFL
ncbi:MAG: flagellar hook-associated protein FlgL [Eubacterium sp.]|nr:flagellar hook-associated protein FlgL [Eubacterium sp.]